MSHEDLWGSSWWIHPNFSPWKSGHVGPFPHLQAETWGASWIPGTWPGNLTGGSVGPWRLKFNKYQGNSFEWRFFGMLWGLIQLIWRALNGHMGILWGYGDMIRLVNGICHGIWLIPAAMAMVMPPPVVIQHCTHAWTAPKYDSVRVPCNLIYSFGWMADAGGFLLSFSNLHEHLHIQYLLTSSRGVQKPLATPK